MAEEARYKLLRVSPEYFVAMLKDRGPMVYEVTNEPIPPDGEVRGYGFDEVSQAFWIKVYSKSFEIVPQFSPTPTINPVVTAKSISS